MIRAILYDMDGVISDSEHLWAQAINQQMTRRGIVIPRTHTYERFLAQHVRGRSQWYSISQLKKYFGLQGSVASILDERLKLVRNIFSQRLRPVPGILGLLKKTAHHYPLAVASSSPPSIIQLSLRKLRVRKYFDVVISGDDFKASKPHPEIFLTAAKRLGVPPRQCLVIEDSYSGVLAAQQAHMTCIGLKRDYNTRRDLQKADRVVQRLFDITLPMIRSL